MYDPNTLENFNSTIISTIQTHLPDYKVSGCAELEESTGQLLYSASLIPPISEIACDLHHFVNKFKDIRVSGFRFIKLGKLIFLTSLPLPDPKFRVQVVYTKE